MPTECSAQRFDFGVVEGRVVEAAIEALPVTLFLEVHKRPPRQIILDLDATDDPLHGHQEGPRVCKIQPYASKPIGPLPDYSVFERSGYRRVVSALWPIDQLFDALRAQARDAAAIGTASPTSTTGITLTSFQKLYFETNATMTFGSLASART